MTTNICNNRDFVKERIKSDLFSLGIRAGDCVLMHSSFKALGEFAGGAELFFEAFLELLGEEGTLIIPTLSYKSVTRDDPVFDVDETPSCIGYLSEYFRTSVKGALRSKHPTHSCCAKGRLAREFTEGHERDITPVGENSPFAKLPKFGGKILMLGCSARPNTSMHGVEETAEPPYCIDRKNPVKYIIKHDGGIIEQTAFRHNFYSEDGHHYEQRYDRMLDILSPDEQSFGKVLAADCHLLDARALWQKGKEKLEESPFFFVD